MDLLIVGINHETAPVALREKVAFTPDQLQHALPDLCHHAELGELAILSTCNRTEVITVAPEARAQAICDWLATYHSLDSETLSGSLYRFAREEAARHLFRVAAGLDSMVLGEPQIFGQVKDCFDVAARYDTLGPALTAVSQATNQIAKKVRRETAIGENPVSAASTAVALSKRLFTDLSTCHALFVGAGEMIELAARHLQQAGVRTMVIANRTLGNAERLAHAFNARAIDLSGIPAQLIDTDILIASTASQLPIIGKGTVERAIRQRRHRPIFMVDLAVPRDIEPEVASLRDVYLYSIDDLRGIIDRNLSGRQQEAVRADAIIDAFVGEFAAGQRTLTSVETLVRFREKHQRIMQAELDRSLKRLDGGEDPAVVVAALAQQLTNKIMHTPSVRLKQAGSEGRDDLVHAVRQLFDLGAATGDGNPGEPGATE